MRRALLFVAALAALVGVAVAIWSAVGGSGQMVPPPSDSVDMDLSARFAGYEPAPEPDGDRQGRLARLRLAAGAEVKRLYEFRVRNGALMRYMPCFCGCGRSAGHHSMRATFLLNAAAIPANDWPSEFGWFAARPSSPVA